MKKIFSLLICALLTLACTSSATKDACIKIYEEGISKLQKANSQKEINDIQYDVSKKIVDLSQGPEGDVQLSASDQMELFDAQQRFYQTIESRARQLLPAEQDHQNGLLLRPAVK